MKILMIDKYFFIKGGAERYYFELSNILKAKNHEVIPFSMKHEDNFPSSYSEFFVENIEYNLSGTWKKVKNSFRIMGRMIYSFHAKNRLEKLIGRIKPDIAHLHMIDHQLSPSILHTLKKYSIPVIQTVHQYKLVCPNYRLYNMYKQQICEKCINGNYFHPIFERCHKDSMAAGLMVGLEMYIHKLMKIYEKNIDLFHVPSYFMGEKIGQVGIPGERIKHLFYTIEIDNYPPNYNPEDYFIYYGRLAKEKGILTLLKAMNYLKNSKLIIVGDGPQRVELENFVEKNNLFQVKFLGIKNGDELNKIVSKSQFVIVPSEWYDNSPLVIYESFSMGKPVIGATIGGIPELIDHEKNGLHFQPGNVDELVERINFLLNKPQLIKEFGMNARKKAEFEFAPEPHYKKILGLYQTLIKRK